MATESKNIAADDSGEIARECYDELADHYHLIFENWAASMQRQAAVLGPLLEEACGPAKTVRVLDCACGIGTQALGLAQQGFQVSGCDVSPRAVARATMEAASRNLELRLRVANMLDLTSLGESPFDAVICMDNALPHLKDTMQVMEAAAQIRSKLRPGGLLMASIRDYDHLIEEKPRVQGPAFYSDQGRRRIVLQVWDWVDDRRYVFHLYITREVSEGWQTLHTSAVYRAMLRSELTEALGRASFKNVRWRLPGETGFYQPIVLAEAGPDGSDS